MSSFGSRRSRKAAEEEAPLAPGEGMKAIRIRSFGGSIEWAEVARPELPPAASISDQLASASLRDKAVGAGMVIVSVRMAGISYSDYLGMHGKYEKKPKTWLQKKWKALRKWWKKLPLHWKICVIVGAVLLLLLIILLPILLIWALSQRQIYRPLLNVSAPSLMNVTQTRKKLLAIGQADGDLLAKALTVGTILELLDSQRDSDFVPVNSVAAAAQRRRSCHLMPLTISW